MSATQDASQTIRTAIRLVEALPAGPLSRDALTMLRSAAARIAQLDTHTEILMSAQGVPSPASESRAPEPPSADLESFSAEPPSPRPEPASVSEPAPSPTPSDSSPASSE